MPNLIDGGKWLLKRSSKGRTQPVVSVNRHNWLATLLTNECEDALISGKMCSLPLRKSSDKGFLEV